MNAVNKYIIKQFLFFFFIAEQKCPWFPQKVSIIDIWQDPKNDSDNCCVPATVICFADKYR